VRPEGLGKLKKLIHLIGSRSCDLPACSGVLHLLRDDSESVLVLEGNNADWKKLPRFF
jgi:hypothetical protein